MNAVQVVKKKHVMVNLKTKKKSLVQTNQLVLSHLYASVIEWHTEKTISLYDDPEDPPF